MVCRGRVVGVFWLGTDRYFEVGEDGANVVFKIYVNYAVSFV